MQNHHNLSNWTDFFLSEKKANVTCGDMKSISGKTQTRLIVSSENDRWQNRDEILIGLILVNCTVGKDPCE